MPKSTNHFLSEIKDSSNGQIHSAIFCQSMENVFAYGGEKDINIHQVDQEITGNYSSKRLLQLSGHNSAVTTLVFNDNDHDAAHTILGSGCFSGTIRTWDVELGKAARSLPTGHKSAVTCIDFFKQGRHMISGSLDTTVKFWDLRRKGPTGIYKHHRDRVTVCKFSPDGEWFITGSADNSMSLIALRTGKVLKTWDRSTESKTSGVNFIEFHPINCIISNNFGRTTSVTELENFEVVSEFPKLTKPPRLGLFHPKKKCFFNIYEDGFETSMWEPVKKLDHVRCDWTYPSSAFINEDENYLRVLTTAKNSVQVHQVNLADVVIDPPVVIENTEELENYEEGDTLTNSPRRTFVVKKSDSPNSGQNSKENSDVCSTDEEGPSVNIFGKMPVRRNRKRLTDDAVEPGEVVKPKIKVENPYAKIEGDTPDIMRKVKKSPERKPSKGSDGLLEKPSKKPLSNDEILNYCLKNTEAITSIGLQRINNFDVILAQWSTGDIVATARQAINLPSSSAFTDFLNLINDTPDVWTLELVTVVVAQLASTLQMKHKEYISVGEKTIELILKTFSTLLISTMNGILGNIGGNRAVDLQKEQREERVQYVRDSLKNTIYGHLRNEKLRLQIDQIP